MNRDWKHGKFEVCDAAGVRETEAGMVRGPFSLGGEGRSASCTHLVHVPSGQPIALFADEALAMSAAGILEAFGDWSARIPIDSAPGVEALVGAGFYATGQYDGPSYVWNRAGARAASGGESPPLFEKKFWDFELS
jgi:hypothetical protein